MPIAVQSQQTIPEAHAIRDQALGQGGLDPAVLRYRVLEYHKFSGKLLGVPIEDSAFDDAVEETIALIEHRADSHFFLEPVGFIQ